MRRFSFGVAMLALLAIAVPGALATKSHHRHRGHKAAHNDTSPGNSGEHKTTICHATGSATNPYVLITVDNHALKAHGNHQDDRDIIPAPRDANGKPYCPTAPPAAPPTTTPPPPTTTTPPATTAPTTGSSPTVSAPAGEVKGQKVTSKKKKAKRRARKPRRVSGFTG